MNPAAFLDKYLRGMGLVALEPNDGARQVYLHNGHGDVVQRMQSATSAAKAYAYDAFGVERAPVAGDRNPFRYCGEYFDLETNTVYLRARSYSPATGRFLSEDIARDGLNWYTYCGNNPVMFIDSSGCTPYSIHTRGTRNQGKYTLYVSPQWSDFGGSVAGIGLGALPVYGPLVGAGYTAGNWATMRLAGYRGIGYDIGDMGGIAAGLLDGLSNNKFFKGTGEWTGNALDALEVVGYLKDWLIDHNYQIEEAIQNQFNSDTWVSSSRNIVDKKFEYAMKKMTALIFEGKIEVRKAMDIFGADAFAKAKGSGTIGTFQYDPLTGEYKWFHQDDYYFFMLDNSLEGTISDYESIMTSSRMRWR